MLGNKTPLSLYTIDVDTSGIAIEESELLATLKQKRIKRIKDSLFRNNLLKEAFGGRFEVSEMFETDQDLKLMRSSFCSEFYKLYEDGFQNYLSGDWEGARRNFEEVLLIKSDDKVAQNLISFMEESEYVPPDDWQGFKFLFE